MKNIHILPTDKPSRLHTYFNLPNYLFLSNKALNWKEAKHIYITSDERIERGDWLFDAENEEHIYRASDVDLSNIRSLKSWYCKKIILTTDQDLIKNGIQAIDDEFLEWFVKNPSCEWVEVKKIIGRKYKDYEYYKQWHLDKIPDWAFDCKIIIPKIISQKNMKNKSIEHNATKFADKKFNFFDKNEKTLHSNCKKSFIEGAKWQQERMYSDEEVIELNLRYLQELGKQQSENGHWINFKEWFEQFKNK